MATDEQRYGDSGKTAAFAAASPPPRGGAVSYFRIDFALRLFLVAISLTALIVLATSKQNKLIQHPALPLLIRLSAKFQNSPALIYLLVALTVTSLYGLLTLALSAITLVKSCATPKLLFFLLASDALVLGVLASATGTAGSVGYVGLKGDSHVNWGKICNRFDLFCRHIGSAVFLSIVGSVSLVALVWLSAFSLYRRSR
ncbi:CASP-like protein 1D1 [Wolffia australiana]